jgi:hypothetical protein
MIKCAKELNQRDIQPRQKLICRQDVCINKMKDRKKRRENNHENSRQTQKDESNKSHCMHFQSMGEDSVSSLIKKINGRVEAAIAPKHSAIRLIHGSDHLAERFDTSRL